jgi:hypothetical protein
VPDVMWIAQSSVGVFSIWLFLSICCSVDFVILFPLVYTAELRVDEFPVDELCGRSLYIRGVDRLGERTKHKHFYLLSSFPSLREYHLLS